jgi:DnaK suppressor protein
MRTPLEAVRPPAASHLTSERLTELGEELERQRSFRVSQLQDLAAAAAEPASSRDAARQQITHALTMAAQYILTDIDAALDRLQIGTYGSCEHCDAAIPFERLETLPMSRLCMPCQYATEASPLKTTTHRWPRGGPPDVVSPASRAAGHIDYHTVPAKAPVGCWYTPVQ